jgi:hypothetical protein
MKWITLFVAAASAFAQHAIAPPQIGFIRDASFSLRPVYGITGTFILGQSISRRILSQAFSGSVLLLKSDSSLAALNPEGKLLASAEVSGGPALFAFSPGGDTALAYIASSNSLVEWQGGVFAPLALHPGTDAVVAIAFPDALTATLIVQRSADALWEVRVPLRGFGTLAESALAGVHAPVLALPSGDLVYADAGGIVVRRATGADVHISAALPASFTLQQMNREWVELADTKTSARFAIRTSPEREGIYRLPE